MTVTETAPAVQADARNRAWRTLLQGALVDVTAAVLLALAPLLWSEEFAFTAVYWSAIGVLAAKTAIMAAASYAMRRLLPPGDVPAGAAPVQVHQAAHRAESVDRDAAVSALQRRGPIDRP